jgi:hypothetical protein
MQLTWLTREDKVALDHGMALLLFSVLKPCRFVLNISGQQREPKIVSRHEGQLPILLDAESRLFA